MFIYFYLIVLFYSSVCVCVFYLYILNTSWLSLTQQTEQQKNKLLYVLQRLLLGDQVRMNLLQHLQHTVNIQ